MKTSHYSTALIGSLLGGLLLAQETQTLSAGGVTNPVVANALALRAASNAVQAASIVWLTNQVVQTTTAVASGTPPLAAVGGVGSVPGVTTLLASTNANQVVTSTRLFGQAPFTSGASTASASLSPARQGLAASRTSGGPAPLTSGSTCVRPGSGLVSWWKAENNANDSAGNNPGERVNGASYDSGMVGVGFSLDGSLEESVEIPYASTMATPTFTIEAWVYPSDWNGGQAFIFGQAYGRQLIVCDGEFGLEVAMMITDEDGIFDGVGWAGGEIPIGQWTHLAGTWDGTQVRLYVNGVPAAQRTLDFSGLGDSTCGFSIGGINNSCATEQYFTGVIDEVSLYDRPLLAGEINAIYAAGAAGKCSTAPSCVSTPPAAIAWWPFEGDASDNFGNCPGGLPNGASFTTGEVGEALSLNGVNQCVRVAYSPSLASGSFSVEAWVNPSGQVDWQAFIFGQGYGSQLDVHPGSWGINVAFYVCTDPSHWYEVDSSGEIPIGEWTHLVGTWDGTYLSLYINGALDQQATPGIVPSDSGCSFNIGGVWDSCSYSGQFFNGLIDEVMYYNQALAPGDVQALYNAGAMGKCVTAYDAAGGFSPTYNPYDSPDGGIWSYGYCATLGQGYGSTAEDFQLYTVPGTFSELNYWSDALWPGTAPVFHNPHTYPITIDSGAVVVPAGGLGLEPGSGGEYSVVRFTAPDTGLYKINATFSALNQQVMATDVHVLANDVEVFQAQVGCPLPSPAPVCNLTVTLNAGACVDFAVGLGASADPATQATGLSAQIKFVAALSLDGDKAYGDGPPYVTIWPGNDALFDGWMLGSSCDPGASWLTWGNSGYFYVSRSFVSDNSLSVHVSVAGTAYYGPSLGSELLSCIGTVHYPLPGEYTMIGAEPASPGGCWVTFAPNQGTVVLQVRPTMKDECPCIGEAKHVDLTILPDPDNNYIVDPYYGPVTASINILAGSSDLASIAPYPTQPPLVLHLGDAMGLAAGVTNCTGIDIGSGACWCFMWLLTDGEDGTDFVLEPNDPPPGAPGQSVMPLITCQPIECRAPEVDGTCTNTMRLYRVAVEGCVPDHLDQPPYVLTQYYMTFRIRVLNNPGPTSQKQCWLFYSNFWMRNPRFLYPGGYVYGLGVADCALTIGPP